MIFNQDAFGSRLKMLRKELKMTQEQLAAELNIGADHLGKNRSWEKRYIHRPPARSIRKAKCFD